MDNELRKPSLEELQTELAQVAKKITDLDAAEKKVKN